MLIMRELLETDEPQISTPRAVYDGRTNLFSIREFSLPNGRQTVRSAVP